MMDTLEEMERLAWALYLDARASGIKSPRLFDEWRRLWKLRAVEVPVGAWTLD